MGRGNACVTGPYEGLFYIDNDDLLVYRPKNAIAMADDEKRLLGELGIDDLREWEYSDIDTQWHLDDVEELFIDAMKRRFPSFFTPPNEFFIDGGRVILINNLFTITFEDNQWSVAVKLLQQDGCCMEGLQKTHYQRYLNGIRDALFEQFETLGVYAGPWTSGTIKREDYVA